MASPFNNQQMPAGEPNAQSDEQKKAQENNARIETYHSKLESRKNWIFENQSKARNMYAHIDAYYKSLLSTLRLVHEHLDPENGAEKDKDKDGGHTIATIMNHYASDCAKPKRSDFDMVFDTMEEYARFCEQWKQNAETPARTKRAFHDDMNSIAKFEAGYFSLRKLDGWRNSPYAQGVDSKFEKAMRAFLKKWDPASDSTVVAENTKRLAELLKTLSGTSSRV